MRPSTDAAALVRQVERAVTTFDHPRTAELCEELIARVRSSDETFPEQLAKRVLAALRRKRQFHLMGRVADALIASGCDGMVVYRQYAQALLDQGLTGAGLGVLAAGMTTGDDADELAELRGLVGRAHKAAMSLAYRSLAKAQFLLLTLNSRSTDSPSSRAAACRTSNESLTVDDLDAISS